MHTLCTHPFRHIWTVCISSLVTAYPTVHWYAVTVSVSCNVFNVAEVIDEYLCIKWCSSSSSRTAIYCLFDRVNTLQWINGECVRIYETLLLIALNSKFIWKVKWIGCVCQVQRAYPENRMQWCRSKTTHTRTSPTSHRSTFIEMPKYS